MVVHCGQPLFSVTQQVTRGDIRSEPLVGLSGFTERRKLDVVEVAIDLALL